MKFPPHLSLEMAWEKDLLPSNGEPKVMHITDNDEEIDWR
jgi:hypothetical protein